MYKVLVVDDDTDIRELIELRLSMDGHEVNGLADPVAALSLAETTSFDLAVLDWSMPSMDGGQLCSRLRELPGLSDAPILVVTAHADPDTRGRAYEAGASGYMAKPFSLQQLSKVVRELLHRGAEAPVTAGPLAVEGA
jgi:DNA-binding response OmpR family regulator